MPLPDLQALAQSYIDRANADVDEAFNAEHESARQEQAAVEQIQAAARERHRRDQLARAAAAADGSDTARFGPMDDDEPEAVEGPDPLLQRRPRVTEAEDDDEEQQTWLR